MLPMPLKSAKALLVTTALSVLMIGSAAAGGVTGHGKDNCGCTGTKPSVNKPVNIYKPVTIEKNVNVYKPVTIEKNVNIYKPVTIDKSINITKNIDASKNHTYTNIKFTNNYFTLAAYLNF